MNDFELFKKQKIIICDDVGVLDGDEDILKQYSYSDTIPMVIVKDLDVFWKQQEKKHQKVKDDLYNKCKKEKEELYKRIIKEDREWVKKKQLGFEEKIKKQIKEVMNHRRGCLKWGKEFCLECSPRVRFLEDLLEELK